MEYTEGGGRPGNEDQEEYMNYGNQLHGIFCCKLHSFFGYVHSKTLQLLKLIKNEVIIVWQSMHQ